MKYTRLCLAIAIVAALLSISLAGKRSGEAAGREASQRRAWPPLKTFQFETVTLDRNGKVINRRTLRAKSYTEDLGSGVELEMVLIPAGTFQMGSSERDVQATVTDFNSRYSQAIPGLAPSVLLTVDVFKAKTPRHQVTVPQLYIGKYEVTQAQWRKVASLPKITIDLSPEPSRFKGDNLPLERVSWDDAVEFCARLSKATGRDYRLPSDAEWEYAARAGTLTPFAFGENITPELVNYNGSYPYRGAAKGIDRAQTTEVGSLGAANRFGLYDMLGNVWEWCQDFWHYGYDGAPRDGSAWLRGGDSDLRVLRGGSLKDFAYNCRSASRVWGAYVHRRGDFNHGFRVAASSRPS